MNWKEMRLSMEKQEAIVLSELFRFILVHCWHKEAFFV